MSAGGPFTAELLCGHHSLGDFRSGDDESDNLARGLLERVRSRDADGLLAVVVLDPQGTVVGIVAAMDLVLSNEQSDRDGGGKWLFYYLLAIAQGGPTRNVWETRTIWESLLNEIEAIRNRRLRLGGYVGEVAVPLRGAPQDKGETGLTRFLRRQDFKPLEANELFWVRRKD